MTLRFIELFAVLACTLFTGAAVYITAVEHPARLSCGTQIAFTQWAPSYRRATVMQASLAIVSGLLGLVRAAFGGGWLWVWAAVLILLVIPFTLVVIRPTNNQLLDPHRDPGSDETRQLVGPTPSCPVDSERSGLDSLRLGGNPIDVAEHSYVVLPSSMSTPADDDSWPDCEELCCTGPRSCSEAARVT
jgi:hypothetical protein